MNCLQENKVYFLVELWDWGLLQAANRTIMKIYKYENNYFVYLQEANLN